MSRPSRDTNSCSRAINRQPRGEDYPTVIKHEGKWWIGWIVEIPGVNSQAKTRRELVANLRSALKEALAINRANAVSEAGAEYETMAIRV